MAEVNSRQQVKGVETEFSRLSVSEEDASPASAATLTGGIRFVDYEDESQLDYVMSLVGRDLSEPYSSKCMLQLNELPAHSHLSSIIPQGAFL